MNASILTIGNELVSGFTVDTNSAWLGQNLIPYNIQVEKVVSVKDDDKAIKNELSNLIALNPNFLFITGGLGPTHDDITRNSIADFFDLEEGFDQNYFENLKIKFAERGIEMPESNRSQAIIYNNCNMLPNPKGTARGMAIERKNIKIFVMPGVPIEMKVIFNNSIIEYFSNPIESSVITLKSFGVSESSLAEKLSMIMDKWNGKINFAFLPSHKGVDLRLTNLGSKNKDLEVIESEIFKNYSKYFFGKNEESLERIVVEILIKKNKTISTAESCTGGQLSNFITQINGSSQIYLGGVVAYSNQMKMEILNVDKNIIENDGAVSEKVAFQMAEGIRKKTNSDIGIGITGVSGPTGGTIEKPVGLVYIAFSSKAITKVKKFILKIDRIMHQEMTSYIALNMVRRYCFGK